MPDLNGQKNVPPTFNLPHALLERAVLNVVYLLRDEPQEIPDMLEALGLDDFARTMVA